MEKFKLDIVQPVAETYYETLGIPQQRAFELIELAEAAIVRGPFISDSMQEVISHCKTLNEVVFITFKLGEFSGYIETAKNPKAGIRVGTMFLTKGNVHKRGENRGDGYTDSKS